MNNLKPITNCHTHIFTSDHVPPYLGKTYLPFGLAYVFSIRLIVSISRWWFQGPHEWKHKSAYKTAARSYYKLKIFIARNYLVKILATLISLFICIQVFYFAYDLFNQFFPTENTRGKTYLQEARQWLMKSGVLKTGWSALIKCLLAIVVMVFIKSGRNFIFFLLKRFFKFFALLPGKETLKYLNRYMQIGRFAFYRNQTTIFQRLRAQYPENTRFVVLPMDMEFMGAGKPRSPYANQMSDLIDIKKKYHEIFHPFVFIDPRRMCTQKRNAHQKDFFAYHLDDNNQVVLDDCDVKDYIEIHHFSGFKIYPALGYFPFEKELLPLWKYAAQQHLPILTHCIRGTIFYRGAKEKAWDTHPVFKQMIGDSEQPLLLPEIKNQEFSINFTHPLNYLCLLKEPLLRQLVADSNDQTIKNMFGFTNPDQVLKSDLHNLKLCFGHYGGEDEWAKYLEADRDNFSRQLISKPLGINFMKNNQGLFSHERISQLWQTTDWYSIISSLILQHPHVYSDISYILHDSTIWPLLKDTLDRAPLQGETRRLSEGILFGTDFYVVRNHKSEKQLFAELEYNLSYENTMQIARKNPDNFLSFKLTNS